MRFHCCLVHPPDRPHVAAFAEMIECVHDGLIALGHHVTQTLSPTLCVGELNRRSREA